MKCIICNHDSNFLTTVKYEPKYKSTFEEAEIYKCKNCGFSFSKTLFEMEQGDWEKLNLLFHSNVESKDKKRNGYKRSQPPYYEQAFFIKVLSQHAIIDPSSMIDFGGGVGTLENILKSYYNITIQIYDPYMQNSTDSSLIYVDNLKKSNAIYNSAYFEHITKRSDLDTMNDFVNDDGAMIIHTVICENIPDDPNWFYYRHPVHSAFHTNKSMEILMEQWNYISSLYCPAAKTWILFKKEPVDLYQFMDKINREFQTDYLYYKKGFVDFWKGF